MARIQNFDEYDALGLADLVASKQVSPAELLEEAIFRLDTVEPQINAVPIRHDDFARDQIARGLPVGRFHGVPFLLKDLTILNGTTTTFGSRAFKGNIADHSSTLATRYLEAGLSLFGKTASPEFGLNLTTEPVLYGPTRNPWNLDHSAGGSSGGAAAVVAARVLPMTHATDGGGSIRVPAACCGLFGLKPTRARTPLGPDRMEGWAGMSCAHAVSISVRDSAALLDVTHGPELGSPYYAPPPQRPYLEEVSRLPGQLRVAFCANHPDGSAIDPEVAAAVRDSARLLESLGHFVEERAPAITLNMGAAMETILGSNIEDLARIRGQALGRELGPQDLETFTLAVRTIGAKTLGADYAAATATLHAFGRQMALFFNDIDIFLTPTLCAPPLKLGQLNMMSPDVPAYLQLSRRYCPWTAMANFSGQPAMSVPLAWSTAGLPLGMMFSARFGEEGLLFRLAGQLEQARPWKGRKPPVCA